MKNRKVDFFIAGFGFSGSSAIAYYLSLHPEMCISIPKETNFFLPENMHKLKNILSWHQYEKAFSHAGKGQILGDASIFYIHSPESIKNILGYNTDAKFVIVLRNPVEMIFASYSQLSFTGNENASSFKEAWELQAERRETKRYPLLCRDPIQLHYRERAFMGKAIKRMLELVPKEQVLFVSFDEICKKTEEVYLAIQRFLCVSPIKLKEYPIVNARAMHKSVFSKYFYLALRRNRLLMNIIYVVLRKLKRYGVSDVSEVNRIFKKAYVEKPIMNSKLRGQIVSELKEDMQLVNLMTGIDVSGWK